MMGQILGIITHKLKNKKKKSKGLCPPVARVVHIVWGLHAGATVAR